jgi:hypothetical protein
MDAVDKFDRAVELERAKYGFYLSLQYIDSLPLNQTSPDECSPSC